jgi:adenine-specific DNA-methyltransferase
LDIPGYASGRRFKTENSEPLLQRIIENTSHPRDWVLDYFLGSGTTTAVAHKLGRKWIGVELDDHFYSVVIPRMKDVLAGDPTGISKDIAWNGGGCFKYHRLEQFEDVIDNLQITNENTFSDPKDENTFQSSGNIQYNVQLNPNELKMELNLRLIEDPFNLMIRIQHGIDYQFEPIDVVETFNYLLGLHVERIVFETFNNRSYLFMQGMHNSLRTAIIWRSMKDINFEEDESWINQNLDKNRFDEIFINGTFSVSDSKSIEKELYRLMFDSYC